MKKLTQTSMLLLALMVAFAGCDAASDVAGKAGDMVKDKAGDMGDMAGLKDMAGMGDFDLEGLKGQFTGITDGFKDVSADNVDGLTSKISGLGDSIGDMGIDSLPGPAKTAVGGVISKFVESVKTAMEGISDEGLLGKLKPAVDGLMEKVSSFM